MTQPLATAHWQRTVGEGTDRCTLSGVDQGWILMGYAVWRVDGVGSRLSYDVRCGPDWQSLSADVAGEVEGRQINLRLVRSAEGWLLNDVLQPGTGECTDLDLSFTPATNLLPIRRLGGVPGEQVTVQAAWLKPDLDEVARLDQIYERAPGGQVQYNSPSFSALLDVDASGFVTGYPDGWHGWVDEA
ncbi:hypothetical protein TRL7639_00094 [Falsiruegeria litorea R37]|uniref:Glycolipid-binding protein n=1 Tax=Falsiruegeria litorea R37 TaxID=1200284 RepID=A0A1Y5R9D4_9RHOB|nr:putative glycolipid-binding domain-containing protein [Falsiruegeria litorea]SLN11809.1 hypothetical protein TRL7639_00094 [Falsiruegeria litorea R37]